MSNFDQTQNQTKSQPATKQKESVKFSKELLLLASSSEDKLNRDIVNYETTSNFMKDH